MGNKELKITVHRPCELVEIADSDFERRFWTHAGGTGDECWMWMMSCSGPGYGQIRHNGVMYYAHRLAFQFVYGEIPKGMLVTHKCDTRGCVNPSHLKLGTHADNMADMKRKHRGSGSKRRVQCKQVGI